MNDLTLQTSDAKYKEYIVLKHNDNYSIIHTDLDTIKTEIKECSTFTEILDYVDGRLTFPLIIQNHEISDCSVLLEYLICNFDCDKSVSNS